MWRLRGEPRISESEIRPEERRKRRYLTGRIIASKGQLAQNGTTARK
jgi:hypothetical protein